MGNSLAFPKLITVLFIALFAFSRIHLSSCSQVMGTVSCTDCDTDYDFSGIKVLVKCDKVNNISEAITDKTGHFKTTLPLNYPPMTSTNCWTKLASGGPTRLYATKRNTAVSKIHIAQGDNDTYTLLTPLVFSKSCKRKCESQDTNISSSKGSITWSFTIDPSLTMGGGVNVSTVRP